MVIGLSLFVPNVATLIFMDYSKLQPLKVINMSLFQTCRVCGCTDNDCRQCIEKTGYPCMWVEKDLCSACEDKTV